MICEEKQGLFDEIVDKGCCKRCALRYLGCCKSLLTFNDPDTCLMNFGLIPVIVDEHKSKIRKTNSCSVCLGLLDNQTLDKMLDNKRLDQVAEYENCTFVAYITFPTCIMMRDHSMKLHLKKTFPEHFNASQVIKVNNAWRYSIEDRLCQKLQKTYSHLSKLTLHFYTSYILEKDEMALMQSYVSEHLSKHTVVSLLESISDAAFENVVQVPPKTSLYEVKVNDLKFFSEALHAIGNYCKYSRKLPQTSFVVNEERATTSIESIIVEACRNILGDCNEIIFEASSFDDKHIRVLGNGRSFHLQFVDPKFEQITKYQCRKIEEEIKKTNLMELKNLRQADRKDILAILDSERLNTKSVKVLCLVYSCKNIDYCINAINMYTGVTVQQKTPIRLIEQRCLRTRKKKIFHIRATKVEDRENLIELDLCTESGFYIPEFINGDFGRTHPSLGDITKAKLEYLAIDVIDFSATLPCLAEAEDVKLE